MSVSGRAAHCLYKYGRAVAGRGLTLYCSNDVNSSILFITYMYPPSDHSDTLRFATDGVKIIPSI